MATLQQLKAAKERAEQAYTDALWKERENALRQDREKKQQCFLRMPQMDIVLNWDREDCQEEPITVGCLQQYIARLSCEVCPRFFYKGKELAYEPSLASQGIQNGTTIFCGYYSIGCCRWGTKEEAQRLAQMIEEGKNRSLQQ